MPRPPEAQSPADKPHDPRDYPPLDAPRMLRHLQDRAHMLAQKTDREAEAASERAAWELEEIGDAQVVHRPIISNAEIAGNTIPRYAEPNASTTTTTIPTTTTPNSRPTTTTTTSATPSTTTPSFS